jgi:hypothetical protein
MVKFLAYLSAFILVVGINFSLVGFSNNNFSYVCVGGFCTAIGGFNLYRVLKYK